MFMCPHECYFAFYLPSHGIVENNALFRDTCGHKVFARIIHIFNIIWIYNYSDVTMSAIASQIAFLAIVYSAAYSGPDQRKHQSPASLVFVRGIHRWPVNSPQQWPVTRKIFAFDDVIMIHRKQHISIPLLTRQRNLGDTVTLKWKYGHDFFNVDTSSYRNDNFGCCQKRKHCEYGISHSQSTLTGPCTEWRTITWNTTKRSTKITFGCHSKTQLDQFT